MRKAIAKSNHNEALERAAAVADAEYNEQARLATFHHAEGNSEAMDRRNAAARTASNIAASIRAMKS